MKRRLFNKMVGNGGQLGSQWAGKWAEKRLENQPVTTIAQFAHLYPIRYKKRKTGCARAYRGQRGEKGGQSGQLAVTPWQPISYTAHFGRAMVGNCPFLPKAHS